MAERKKKFNWEEWKAKKNARREKQRETNLIRVKAMHKLRLEKKAKSTSKHPPKLSEKIYIGCSGWFYWHWRGKIYPAQSKPNVWFSYYRNKFSTVELNAPFYSWPTVHTVKHWSQQCSKKFIYTVKVSELITHVKKFVRTKKLIDDFDLIANLLGKQFGCFLYQFPPSFKFTSARLKQIVKQLNINRRNVVEFRHISWWNEEVYNTFRQHNIIFCSCSSPKFPEKLIQTHEEVYIRFHGTSKWYKHNYTKKELTHWIDQINASKVKRVWAYFNNDREGFAIANATVFIKLLKKYIK